MSILVIGAVLSAGLISVDSGPNRSTQSSQALAEPMTTRTVFWKQLASNLCHAQTSQHQLSWREDDVVWDHVWANMCQPVLHEALPDRRTLILRYDADDMPMTFYIT